MSHQPPCLQTRMSFAWAGVSFCFWRASGSCKSSRYCFVFCILQKYCIVQCWGKNVRTGNRGSTVHRIFNYLVVDLYVSWFNSQRHRTSNHRCPIVGTMQLYTLLFGKAKDCRVCSFKANFCISCMFTLQTRRAGCQIIVFEPFFLPLPQLFISILLSVTGNLNVKLELYHSIKNQD